MADPAPAAEHGALLLLLLDSRSPAGAHNHSGAMEPAVMAGLVSDLHDVETFCRARLHTVGRVAAAFAAAACALQLRSMAPGPTAHNESPDTVAPPAPPAFRSRARSAASEWAELDAELDARTPSEATRASSRQLGGGLLRLVRAMAPDFEPPWPQLRPPPHHPLVLGAAVAATGGTPELAARAAALHTVTGPASAAVRLLGLDPFAAQAMLARLAGEIDADHQNLPADLAGDHAQLPADASPVLDLLAEFHLTTEVRLFAS